MKRLKKPPALASPYRFRSVEELAEEMNLSVAAIRALQKWKAPFLAKKSHPELLFAWMKAHPDKLQKVD